MLCQHGPTPAQAILPKPAGKARPFDCECARWGFWKLCAARRPTSVERPRPRQYPSTGGALHLETASRPLAFANWCGGRRPTLVERPRPRQYRSLAGLCIWRLAPVRRLCRSGGFVGCVARTAGASSVMVARSCLVLSRHRFASRSYQRPSAKGTDPTLRTRVHVRYNTILLGRNSWPMSSMSTMLR